MKQIAVSGIKIITRTEWINGQLAEIEVNVINRSKRVSGIVSFVSN